MDPSLNLPPLNVPALLRAYNLRPKKSLGQNFLVDESALNKVTAAAEIGPQSDVLEIGAGLGSLTRRLAAAARQVVAVELDGELFPILRETLAPFNNVRLVQGDMLELDPAALLQQPGYVVAANIPYYITSAIIRHLLEAAVRPARVVLTVQKEVARRICAQAGDLSLLALSVQVFGAARTAAQIPAGSFYPAPDVDSSVVRIDLYPTPRVSESDLDLFFKVIRAGFSQKRKTLRNALSAGLQMEAGQTAALLNRAAIDPQRRAETVDIPEWARLIQELKAEK